MKKNLMLIALLLMSTLMFAQRGSHQGGPKGKPNPEAMAARRADRMKTEVSLTDEQYTKVKAIFVKFSEDQAKVRKDSTLTRDASREQTKQLMEATEAEVNKVLTPAQQTKWAEYKKTQQDRRGSRRGKGGADADDTRKK